MNGPFFFGLDGWVDGYGVWCGRSRVEGIIW